MPGANTRALEKAKGLAADALILDLEDAVAPDAKPEARANVVAAVTGGGYGRRELAIRVNALGTPWGADDVRAAAGAGPDAVLVPKVESADGVHEALRALDAAGAPAGTSLWVMLETPLAVLRAAEIAGASERLTVLVMGTNDLSKELRCAIQPGREPMLYALGACVAAARSAGKVILDGVYNAIDDPDGFAAECRQGVAFGFDGKTLIHPSQLEPCNAAWAPSEADVAQARRIIQAFEQARAEGRGVVTVDGRMIENLHVDNARRALAMAEAIAALEEG
ncbi:MAG: CoA ester lyase [Acidimicrobiales bacterium]|nr:CoA ester lyase [Acidimicrobiales bacterium]